MSDGRVWCVVSYPDGATIHRTDTYEAAEKWRRANKETSVILPAWPDDGSCPHCGHVPRGTDGRCNACRDFGAPTEQETP